MRFSQLFTKTSKTTASDADSVNAKLLTQAGFISKQMAGVYNYLPLGLKVLSKIQNIIREEMDAIGANEILMPALTQEENYAITGRDATMDDIFFKTEGAGGMKMILNPTQEEVVTPLVQKFIFSYRDLPLAVYQIQNKFRNEPRAKSGLLRGREFIMKDLYSFHSSEEDMNSYYEIVKKAYFNIFNRLGIGEITYLTFASGGTFSKYSHEFQTLTEIGEDTIYVCEKCHVAINREIIDDQKSCPECGNVDLVEKKAVEVGNIFKQRTNFTAPFNCVFKDEKGVDHPVEMAAYGIGTTRAMGLLVEIFHDDKGIVWPESVAPYRVHLSSLGKEGKAAGEAEKLYQIFKEKKIGVLYDDRGGISAGEKLADADLIGLPYRVIVSKKTLEQGSVELKKRNEKLASMVALEKIAEYL